MQEDKIQYSYSLEQIRKDLADSREAVNTLLNDDNFMINLSKFINFSCERIKSNSKIIFCGNGGSAAESQHFASELTSKYRHIRNAINSVALTTDTSAITSIGNDLGYEYIFSRQIEAIGQEGDILIALSTSGRSSNIINALKAASENKINSYLWTGDHDFDDLANIENLKIVKFPSKQTSLIQEQHLIIGHIYCGALENYIMNL